MSRDGAGGPIRVPVPRELEPLIPAYVERRHTDVERIRQALAVGDLETVRSIGHAIKGSGAGYGFERLSTLARDIEFAARDGDSQQVQRSLDHVVDYLDRIQVVYHD